MQRPPAHRHDRIYTQAQMDAALADERARADEANKLARLSQDNELRWMRLCDLLHVAVCQAVVSLNQGDERRIAHTLLRQVLVDYADAPRPPTTEIENRAHQRGRAEQRQVDAEIARGKLAEYEKAEARALDNNPDDACYYDGKGTAAIEIEEAILADVKEKP